MAKTLRQSLVFGLSSALKSYAQGNGIGSATRTFWATTTANYVPNSQEFQADGGRYGARYQAITEIERAQEFAIAVNAIAREIGSAEYKVEWKATDLDDPKPITNFNLPVMKLLAQPNPLHTWQSWIETATLLLIPSGNCYILMDPLSAAGTPMALWLLRPDRTRPIRQNDPLNPVQAYEHFSEDGKRYVFPAERVLHIKLPNPLTDYQGLGAVQTLASTLEIDVRSMESNINLFKQGGRLSTVIEGLEEDDPIKMKELIDKIKSSHMGSENAHKVLLLKGNAKLNAQASQGGPKEADYKTTREDISRATGGMLGVPPMKMGQLDQINRSTATVQQQEFLTNGVWPHMNRFVGALNIIVRKFDSRLTFVFPKRGILDPDTAYNYMRFGMEFGAMSPNDAREKFLNMPRSKDPTMDAVYIINTQVPIENAGQPPMPPPLPDKPAIKPVDAISTPGPRGRVKLSEVPKLGGATKSIGMTGKTHDADGRPFPKGTQEQRRYLAAMRSSRPKIERAIAAVFEKHFLAVTAKFAVELEKRGRGKAVSKAGIPAMLASVRKAYDDSGTPKGLEAHADAVYQAQMLIAADDASNIYTVSMDGFDQSSVDFENARMALGKNITGVDDQIKEKLQQMIAEAAERGLSPWEIANGTTDGSFIGLKNAAAEISQERAMLIARTEAVNLQDAVNTEAYKRMGVTACDCIGCEDFVVMPGEAYGCNSQDIPVSALPINFHPNHNGAVVPRAPEQES